MATRAGLQPPCVYSSRGTPKETAALQPWLTCHTLSVCPGAQHSQGGSFIYGDCGICCPPLLPALPTSCEPLLHEPLAPDESLLSTEVPLVQEVPLAPCYITHCRSCQHGCCSPLFGLYDCLPVHTLLHHAWK